MAGLDDAHAAREAWWGQTRDVREAAEGADTRTRPAAACPSTPTRPSRSRSTQPGTEANTGERPGSEPELAEDGGVVLGEDDEIGDGRAPQDLQQAFDLDVGGRGASVAPRPVTIWPVRAHRRGSARHQQFLDGLAMAHQRGLDEIDPDGQMHPAAREAALRARNFEQFSAELRAEHGAAPGPRTAALRPRPRARAAPASSPRVPRSQPAPVPAHADAGGAVLPRRGSPRTATRRSQPADGDVPQSRRSRSPRPI